MRKIDRAGQRHNYFTVVSENKSLNVASWNCRCDCGEMVVVRGGDLVSGRSKSCRSCGMKRQAMKVKKGNDFRVDGAIAYVDLSRDQSEDYLIIDSCDVGLVIGNSRTWRAKRSKGMTYALSSDSTAVHRLILGLKQGDGIVVDHIDGNGLNCRRSNMRATTQKENCRNSSIGKQNTSSVLGVCFHRRMAKWQVRIGDEGKEVHVGYFSSKDDAVRARKEAEKILGYHPSHGKPKAYF